MDPQVRNDIECMLDDRCFTGWGGGPVCSSLSSAVIPPCRTPERPYGRPGLSKKMRKKVRDGNSFAQWAAHLIRKYHGRLWFWVENPQSSWFWRLPCYRSILHQHLGGFLQLDYCRFGMPWRKRTRFYTNIVELVGPGRSTPGMHTVHSTLHTAPKRKRKQMQTPFYLGQTCYCLGGHVHQLLKGTSPSGLPWTKVAEPYPHAVAEILALGVAAHCGWVNTAIDLDAISQAASS